LAIATHVHIQSPHSRTPAVCERPPLYYCPPGSNAHTHTRNASAVVSERRRVGVARTPAGVHTPQSHPRLPIYSKHHHLSSPRSFLDRSLWSPGPGRRLPSAWYALCSLPPPPPPPPPPPLCS
jgi:hypothetical protein